MNFSSAFKYPFRNFAKVMSIVLVLTIAFAVFIAMILNSYDWTPLLAGLYGYEAADSYVESFPPIGGTTIGGILGLLLVAIVSGFWLSGYSIEVIRSVMREDEWMPGVNFGRNVKDGAYLFVSSVAYWLALLVLIVFVAVVVGFVGASDGFGSFITILSIPVIAVVSCLMGWGYFVGMARFAAEGDYRASWQIWRNMRLARQHWGTGISLLLMMILFSIVYGIVRQVVDGIFGGLLGANLLAGITLSIIIYYIFNLTQHFSTQHLIAQYAWEIGLRGDHYNPEKDKVGGF